MQHCTSKQLACEECEVVVLLVCRRCLRDNDTHWHAAKQCRWCGGTFRGEVDE